MCWYPIAAPVKPTKATDKYKLNLAPTRGMTGDLTYAFFSIYPDRTFHNPGKPLHLLQFPDILKADGQYIKMRCHFAMTTTFR